jgi:hypothetical protein
MAVRDILRAIRRSSPLPSTERSAIGRYDLGEERSGLFGLCRIARTALRKQLGWWPVCRQLWKSQRTWVLIIGQAICRIRVGISSAPGTVFPASTMAFFTSVAVISENGRDA